MKNLKSLLTYWLVLCVNVSISQTKLGTINVDGKEVTIYYSLPAAVITPPVIVQPQVVTTPTNNDLTVLAATASDCFLGKKKITLKPAGGSGNYQVRYGDFPNIWYDGVDSFDMNADSHWVVFIKDKSTGQLLRIDIDSGECQDKTNFKYTLDNGAVTLPPVIEPPIIQPQTQTPTTTNRPLFGAVRWDWWADNFECTTKWLSPNKYHYKAPFFAKETSPNSLEFKGNTQEILDKEIEYATYAGIDYFAFDWYEGHNDGARYNGSYGRELFKKSTKKGSMKMAYILEATSLGGEFSSERFKSICTDFGRDDYQKINGRPLFFYMTYPPLTPSQVDIINKTYSQIYPGAPLPYIVNAIQVGEQEAQMNNKTGIAAWSQYTGYSQQGDIKMRDRYKAAGVKLIPTLTVGWDTRPIAENPCSWYQNAPFETEYLLKGEALKNHLVDTINFVKNNPEACEANTILCYAWNENAEGGYIVPTIVPGTNQINTETIEIFRQVLKPNQKEQ